MSTIRVHDKNFDVYLSEAQIQQRIKEMADAINRDYQGKKVYFIAVLNGSFMFAADMFKYLNVQSEICFIKLVSYKGLKSSGDVATTIGLDEDLHQKHVIILEDIIDTGNTIESLFEYFKNTQRPKSLKVASLLLKPDVYKKEFKIDYVAKEIPNKFVLGYGLDYDELGRNLPDLYQLSEGRINH